MNTRQTARRRRTGQPLSRDRIVSTAVELADEKGAAGVTMRAVGSRLGVEAMSLYNYVAGREGILDGMVDAVFSEIWLPTPDAEWKEGMRRRAESARAALKRHPWAAALMDSRKHPGPATFRHHDAVLGCLRHNGFSVPQAAQIAVEHAMRPGYSYGDEFPFGLSLILEGLSPDRGNQ